MSDLYDYYLECGGPPLPDGYSFRIGVSGRADDRYEFRILAPPTRWRKKRRAEYLTDDYTGACDYGRVLRWTVDEYKKREGTDPRKWFVSCMRATYASWRAVTYEAEMRERWNIYVGTHP